jgi:RND family efflux transporter MFP subunit
VKPGTTDVKRPAVTGVVITEIRPQQVDEYYETSGTVRARTISTIASRMIGAVTSLKVKEGDRVRAGQVLMTIDDRDVAQRVKAAEKALDAAKQSRSLTDVTYRRYKRLYDEKAVSQQEIDQIETQKKVADIEYERAKAMLAETQVNHGFTRITAPTSGVVTAKKIDPGSMAVPGAPVLVIEDTSSFTLETNLDENLSGKLRSGMPVEVVIDSIGQQTNGTISEIIPSIDPMSRTFLAKIGIKGPLLRTGLYAKVRIPLGKKEAIVVPEKAIVEKGQLTGVYAVDGKGIITYRLIRAGKHYSDTVEVLSGINPNDRIITDGVAGVVDGGIVKAEDKTQRTEAGK